MYRIKFFFPDSPGYSLVKLAVQKHYFKYFGAIPNPHPDHFICLMKNDSSSDIVACAGITCASSGKLFSEYYLDRNLDEIYSFSRNRILEVSSFSAFCSGVGAGQTLLKNIMQIYALRNYLYIVLTATHRVQQILQSITDDLDFLGVADPRKVKDTDINWGSYYDFDPWVVVARLDFYNDFIPLSESLQSLNLYKSIPDHISVLQKINYE